MVLVARYLVFYLRQRRIQQFFGHQVLLSAAIFVAATILIVIMKISLTSLEPAARLLAGVAFAMFYAITLSSLLPLRFSNEYIEFISCLGFTKLHARLLARIMVSPVSLASALFFCILFTEGLPWHLRLLCTACVFAFGDAASFCMLGLQNRGRLQGARQKQLSPLERPLHKKYKSPFRAFFRKDIRMLCTPLSTLAYGMIIFIDLFLLLIAYYVAHLLPLFIIFLYVFVVLLLSPMILSLYKGENKAYCYYRAELRLNNMQILVYKLPLQLAIIASATLVYGFVMAMAHGFGAMNLLALIGTFLYFCIYCMSLGIWYLRRLNSGRNIEFIFEMLSFYIISSIPGLALLCLAVIALEEENFLRRWRLKDVATKKYL